jgi:hypothetical protein
MIMTTLSATFSKSSFLRKAGWFAAIALTATAVLLHWFSFTVVGGLWRDEVGLANIALLPSWKEVVWGLMHDHCPVVFPAVVRTWVALGLAHTDAGLRVLGLCIGLFLLASFWAASRMMGKGLPLLSLAIVAVNPVVIRYGDSIRGYALGIALIALTMGLIWRFIEAPDAGRGLLAGAAAVVSVQTLYQNAFFLLAICIGGMVVSFRRHKPSQSIGVLGIGFVAAISLLPYVNPIRQAQSWWVVSQSGTDLEITLDRLSRLNGPFFGVWMAVAALAVVFGIGRAVLAPRRDPVPEGEDLPLFGSIALVLGAVGFGVFIQLTGLLTQVWYYIPLLCFTVLCCDIILPRALPVTNIIILLIAVGALVFSSSAYPALRWRQTNGDLMAAQISKEAAAGDLIIVHPWYYGLTFAYYYRGAIPWTTLPPIGDYRFHRYDLLKQELATANAIGPVLERVETTLRSGNRVWVVGRLPLPPSDNAVPTSPPPAPNGPRGWDDQPYSEAWGLELRYLLEHHVTNATRVVDPMTNSIPINPAERMTLIVTSGWKVSNPTNSP